MAENAKRVLLVDDEEKLLTSIARRMEVLGFVPFTATNGMAAIDIARKHPVDLAIVDLYIHIDFHTVDMIFQGTIKPYGFLIGEFGRDDLAAVKRDHSNLLLGLA